MKLDSHLKNAITALPVKEKDKLLLRLVAKDKKLVNRLIFELLEHGETRDERAQDLRRALERGLPEKGRPNFSIQLLQGELRNWSARITEHVDATKDKPGEIALQAFMLLEAFRRHWDVLQRTSARRAAPFALYLVRRVGSLLKKVKGVHEDYYIEFRRDLNELLHYIWKWTPSADLARLAQLPREWRE
jgi:hypothetical protein